MADNEKTSKPVATIASEILKMSENNPGKISDELWKEIRSLAASALTQTADKPKFPLTDHFKKLANAKQKNDQKNAAVRAKIFKALKESYNNKGN